MLEAERVLGSLDKQLREWELERLLGGPYDQGGAVLSIQARPANCANSDLRNEGFCILWFGLRVRVVGILQYQH